MYNPRINLVPPVRNTLQFSVDRPIYFHGILAFTGDDKDTLGIAFYDIHTWLSKDCFQDLSIPVVFERVTSKLTLSFGELLLAKEVTWSGYSMNVFKIFSQMNISTIHEARKKVKEKGHIKNIDSILLEAPVCLQRKVWHNGINDDI